MYIQSLYRELRVKGLTPPERFLLDVTKLPPQRQACLQQGGHTTLPPKKCPGRGFHTPSPTPGVGKPFNQTD